MSLEHLWAAWRGEYVAGAGDEKPAGECIFCSLVTSSAPGEETLTVWRGGRVAAVLNAFPYTSGHLMVLPERHVADLEALTTEESTELWTAVVDAVRALKAAYRPDGINVGANLGRAAGAGIPGHVHVHLLPRWNGDTNFMTTVGGTRVQPETLDVSFRKVRAAWPPHG